MKEMIEEINMNPNLLICDCSSREHQIIIDYDEEYNQANCYIHLVQHGCFLRRLKLALKYIFGHKSRHGHWDEFIFKPEHAKPLLELAKKLK